VGVLQATPSSPTRNPAPGRVRRRLLRVAVAFSVLLGVAGYLLLHLMTSPAREGCTVSADGREVDLDLAQAANASTIAAVATSRGLPERAVTIALATSLQESKLENIDYGDRDSLGLFQQRPSQGWGTAAQISDPVYASNSFYDALEKVPDYTRLPLTVAAQRVQKSGYPEAYAKHEQDASTLAAALTGRSGGALRCTVHDDGTAAGKPSAADAARVVREVKREFAGAAGPGRQQGTTLRYPLARPGVSAAAGPAAGGSGAGTHASTLPNAPGVTAGPAPAGRRGWALAHWAVAHAKTLHIERVTYREKVWTVADSEKGWRNGPQSHSDAATPDEVRISVAGK
jgi:hypothetical protein